VSHTIVECRNVAGETGCAAAARARRRRRVCLAWPGPRLDADRWLGGRDSELMCVCRCKSVSIGPDDLNPPSKLTVIGLGLSNGIAH
jgi:hypothetical protein